MCRKGADSLEDFSQRRIWLHQQRMVGFWTTGQSGKGEILAKLKDQFADSRKADERGIWFIYTIVAIIIPFTGSKTSNIRRCLTTLFGFHIAKKRFYTFMASSKIPWQRLWPALWNMIPEPLTQGRLLLALDDYINPKTGRKIFACAKTFDHAAKQNQIQYPWAQNVVAVGLLKTVFAQPGQRQKKMRGRPAKYGKKLGAASMLAEQFRPLARSYEVNLYGRVRTVSAYERQVMLKTIKCAVKVSHRR